MRERLLDDDDVKRLLQSEVNRAGNLRALAAKWELSFGYIADVIRGDKQPGEAILSRLGLEAAPRYRRIIPAEEK